MAGRKPKNNMLSVQEIDKMNDAVKVKHFQYGRMANDAQTLDRMSSIVADIGVELREADANKVDLSNTQAVKLQTERYVNSCSEKGIVPSKMGLARSLGITRQGLDFYCKSHPQSPSALFLEITFDAFSEILSLASLSGSVNPVYAIFIAKALFSWRDNYVCIESSEQYDEKPTTEQIIEKYRHLLSDFEASEVDTKTTKKAKKIKEEK